MKVKDKWPTHLKCHPVTLLPEVWVWSDSRDWPIWGLSVLGFHTDTGNVTGFHALYRNNRNFIEFYWHWVVILLLDVIILLLYIALDIFNFIAQAANQKKMRRKKRKTCNWTLHMYVLWRIKMCFTDSKTCLNFEESMKIIISFQNLVCVAFFNTLLPSKQNWKLVPLFLLYCALMTNSKVLSKTALSYEKEGTKQLYYLMREIEACILLPGIYKRKNWTCIF